MSLTDFLPTVRGEYTADDAMYAAALASIKLGFSAYAAVPESMQTAPSNRKQAAEQAVYWLSFATRRAMDLGDTSSEQSLWAATEYVRDTIPWTGDCSDCMPSSEVLGYAIKQIKLSSLPEEEKTQLVKAVRRLRNGVMLRTGAAIAGVVGVLGVGLYFWRKRS
jgi:hypothetical protein